MMMQNQNQNQQSQFTRGTTIPAGMMLNPQAKQMLTQAGVSNFSSRLIEAQKMLQQVMERLYYAQNQVQVQAQAQQRELQRMEMQVSQTLQQFQAIQQESQSQGSGMLM